LLAVIVALAVAASARHSYRRTRLGTVAGVGLICLDATLLTAVMLVAPVPAWPLALAVSASATRLVATSWALPRVLTR
jgi:hypothetical protein